MNTIEGTRLWTLSEGGHYQGVDTIERTRLRTLSEGRETGGGDRSCRGTGGGDRSCRETGGGDRSNAIVGTIIGKCNQYLLLALSQGWQWS